jgi:hypothetical protein
VERRPSHFASELGLERARLYFEPVRKLAVDVERIESMSLDQRTQMGQQGRDWLLKNANQKDWCNRFVKIVEEATKG